MEKRIQPKRVGTKVIIPCRVSYVHLDAPWSNDDKSDKKYSLSCIIPKDDKETIAVIDAAIAEAKQSGVSSKWNGKMPRTLKNPVHDGDAERPDDEAYKGAIYMGANSKTAVRTLNRLRQDIPATDIYSGCYALVSITFFPYSGSSNGIGAGLNIVMKTDDGEKLGGGGDPTKDFDGMDLGVDEGLDDM